MQPPQETSQVPGCSCAVMRALTCVPRRYLFAGVMLLGEVLRTAALDCMYATMSEMVDTNYTASNSSSSDDDCPAAQQDHSAADHQVSGQLTWDVATQGYVLSAATWGALASVLIGGRLSELVSPTRIIASCYAANAACHLVLPVLARWSAYSAIACQILQGVLTAPEDPARYALISSWFAPKERHVLTGIVFSATELGYMLSGCFTPWLARKCGWEAVFYLYGVLAAVFGGLALLLLHDSPHHHPNITHEEKNHITLSLGKEFQEKLAVPWRELLTSPAVWAHVSMHAWHAYVFHMYKQQLTAYLRVVLHYDIQRSGFVAALPFLPAWFSELGFSVLSQWVRRKHYLGHLTTYKIFNAVATLCPAVLLLALPQLGCHPSATVALLAVANSCSTAFIGGSMLNHMDIAINFSATISGLAGTARYAVELALPSLTAAIRGRQETMDTWGKVFYVSGAVSAVPYVIYLRYGAVHEQPWNRLFDDETDKARRGTGRPQTSRDP